MDGHVAKGIYVVTFARVGKLSPSFISFSHSQKQSALKQENLGRAPSLSLISSERVSSRREFSVSPANPFRSKPERDGDERLFENEKAPLLSTGGREQPTASKQQVQLCIQSGWSVMSHMKWRETKQQPSMLPCPAVPGCCLVSFLFLCDIHSVDMDHMDRGRWTWTQYRDSLKGGF